VEQYIGLNENAPTPDPPGLLPPPPGPETVPGATSVIAEGFEPLESLTGAAWVINVWPAGDKRSVPETRPEWLDDDSDGRLWLVRSPWAGISALDALSLVWANLPRDPSEPEWPAIARQVLSWDQDRARNALAEMSQ
jgi:hypothetical protein